MSIAEETCASKQTLEWNFPEDGREINLVLKPKPAVDGVPQYWQLNEAGNPGEDEAYGNMHFRFKSGAGFLTLNITLDASEFNVDDLQFFDYPGWAARDGVVPLNPDFRHQFLSRVVSRDRKELKIRLWDSDLVPDNLAFLWFCYSPSLETHFVSGDPQATLEPL